MTLNDTFPELLDAEDWHSSRIKQLKTLLQIYYRNLNYTEEQIALTSPTPSLALLNQRDQLNEAISIAKSELVALGESIKVDLSPPTPPTKAKLEPSLWFYEGEKLVNLVELDAIDWSKSVYFGRSKDCQIMVRQEYIQVSRHHAELFKVDDTYTLRDSGSTYGTYVNGIEIDQEQNHALVDSDRVVLGAFSGRDGLPTKRACFFIFRKD
ncbi:MAG: FHA domain-containing protein [Chloroflexi bacterium]|nr:FHA domain-containing protein [Chloroflexota bacterium]